MLGKLQRAHPTWRGHFAPAYLVGSLCLGHIYSLSMVATYSFQLDDCWYRGKVVGQRDKLVDVFFVDFGNTDRVDDINVLALPQEFGDLPIQVIFHDLRFSTT